MNGPPVTHYAERPDGTLVQVESLGTAGSLVVPIKSGSEAEKFLRDYGVRVPLPADRETA